MTTNEGQRRLLDDCFLHDKDRLSHTEALDLLQQRIAPIAAPETVELSSAHGRILANDVVATRNIPAFDNAAVDGYALNFTDIETDKETRMSVSMRIPAGATPENPLKSGTVARIFTGATVPEAADTIIMQEDVSVGDNGEVTFPAGIKQGINLRPAGEDLTAGKTVVAAGERLRAPELTALASCGCNEVTCFKPLSIGLLSTGDEIIRPGTPFAAGNVYDANFFLLKSLIASTSATVTDLGIAPDTASDVERLLLAAAEKFDVIITSGGASRGEEDHVVETINRIGTLHAWQLAIKPGRPMSFGQIGDKVVLGLPGNPVAVMVCFMLYVRPLLLCLGGGNWSAPQRYLLPAAFNIEGKKTDRREFMRGWIEKDSNGNPQAQKYPKDGSGLISSLRAADGLIELDETVSRVLPGDMVAFIPFPELGILPR
jgi:molybdopterin molybdotransferase